jgi:hypothetical protein
MMLTFAGVQLSRWTKFGFEKRMKMAEPIEVEKAISEIEQFISEKKIEVGDASVAMCVIIGRNIGTHAAGVENLSEGAMLHAKKIFVEALRVFTQR